MLNQKIILEETLKTDHLNDFGGLQSPNTDENNENYNQVMNAIKGYDAPSEQNKAISSDQQQNDNNTGSSALRLTNKTDSFKVQQLELNESREYHSFLSDDDIQVDINEHEAKKMEEVQQGNDVEFETCNHDEPNDSCEVDEELQNRINEVIMIPNTTRHISIQPRMDLKELDAKTMSNMYNLPEKTFKNPFLKFNKEEVTPLSVFEGFLKKKTLNVIPTWQNRYFVLENKKLFYYKTKEKGLISGCLDFDLISIKIEVLNGNSFKIIPEKAKRAFVLKAENKEETTKWVQALEEHRRRSKGGKSSITVGVNLKKFWKHDRISPSDFLDQVDTGDLLLFKTKHPNAKIQRSFTGSDYDHVAILLKYMSGEIVLFEAASKNGVSLCRWKTFLLNDWKKLYARIMYRKLCMKRKDDIITAIEDFVKGTVGKKYKVNLTKLFKKKVAVGEEENKKNRTFFCSELVAAFYKKINVLAADAASCGFLPGSFSSEKKIQLMNDAYFEHEKMIDFTLEEEIFGKL